MKLDFIALDKLDLSPLNMRHGKKPPQVADILPSIAKRGVLQSLVVRPEGEPGRFGVLAGSRRLHAARLAAEQGAEITAVPCAILDESDDADAVEASLLENFARLDPDEVTRWEAFVKLVKQGRTPENIAATFALPEAGVRRILALGNLLPRIRDLYRREDIDAPTVRYLTMASKQRQRDWLALVDDPEQRAPTGQQLKAWLLGGQSIRIANALFDPVTSGLGIVADLFGDESFFADSAAFWTAQHAAIEARRADYLDAGWSEAVVIGPERHFYEWEYEKTPKRKGGRVYIALRPSGEVSFHEGYLPRAEAAARAKAESREVTAKPVRPEVSSTLNAYIDLHRHAAVRAALLCHPGVALRLMVAHAIAGSLLWSVQPEPQACRNDAVRESVECARGEAVFDERRRAVLALLDLDPERATLLRRYGDSDRCEALFLRLLDLPDAAVMDVITIVMGESLAAGSPAVDAVGSHIGIDMADWWQADDALFDLIRDKEVAQALVGEVAGDLIARANAGEKTKVLKKIVSDHRAGADGRTKVERWVPRWMAFPPAAYTERGGVGSVAAHRAVQTALAEPGPHAPEQLAA